MVLKRRLFNNYPVKKSTYEMFKLVKSSVMGHIKSAFPADGGCFELTNMRIKEIKNTEQTTINK